MVRVIFFTYYLCLSFYSFFLYFILFFQYSLTHKTENAHEDSIWTCAWGCPKRKKDIEADNEDSRYNQNIILIYCLMKELFNCVFYLTEILCDPMKMRLRSI